MIYELVIQIVTLIGTGLSLPLFAPAHAPWGPIVVLITGAFTIFVMVVAFRGRHEGLRAYGGPYLFLVGGFAALTLYEWATGSFESEVRYAIALYTVCLNVYRITTPRMDIQKVQIRSMRSPRRKR